MQSSSPTLRLAVLDYHTLLQYSSSSLSPQQDALPSYPYNSNSNSIPTEEAAHRWDSGVGCCGSSNGVFEGLSSEHSDDIVDNSLKSEAALAKEKDLLVAEVMTALGPRGCGLLAVKGVPEVATWRKRLLPVAKKLALMPDNSRRPVLKKYGLSTDVPLKRPDRPVSAFATKLQYTRHSHATDGSCILPPFSKCSPGCFCDVSNSKGLSSESENWVGGDSDLERLESLVRQLGACMVEVGLLIALVCDSAIPGAHLENAIWESGSVKARLIHYHSYTENDLLSHSAKTGNGFANKGTSHKLSKMKTKGDFEGRIEPPLQTVQAVGTPANLCTAPDNANAISDDLWQEWHYDYGILTVLTAPMFLCSSSFGPTRSVSECESHLNGHSGLRILSRGVENFVSVPPGCLIVQVGEAAQIASGGKLAAVAHCVCRPPTGQIDTSRETFVTFLQPAWDRVLRPPVGVTREEVLNLGVLHKSSTTCVEPMEGKGELLRERTAELLNPRPLCSSDREDCDGATVAEMGNVELVDKCADFLSQSKKDKEYTEVTKTQMPSGQVQPLSTVDFLTPARASQEDKLFTQKGSAGANTLSEMHTKLASVVPSLGSRWKEGFTFAEFSRETTAQYYGAHGRQSQ